MGQGCLRGLTSRFVSPVQLLQSRRREYANGRSGPLISPDEPMIMDDAQYPFVTHIRVTHISPKLRRIPIGFYVSVKSKNGIHSTLNKPIVVGKDVVEWDTEILLPSERSSKISFSVLASFELGSTLGGGEVICELDVTVGELLDRSSESETIRLSEQEDGNVEIKIRIITGPSEYAVVPNPTPSGKIHRIEGLMDLGYRALVRYRESQEQRILDESIGMFEQARDLCPPGHPSRATVLFSLANTKMMDCRMNDISPDFDMLIKLYRNVLALHSHDHPNYPFILLGLGVGLKARFQRQADEAHKAEGDSFLLQVLDVSQPDSYVYQAAILALNCTANTKLLPWGVTPSPYEHSDDDEEKVDRLDSTLQWIFYPDSSTPAWLDPLGVLFCVRLDL
ncbi:hypothetical protein JVU11DRAFT_9715 [Chiua virens]|nr:hypothetical protein JVU11DRAFT_9715 [Chiua virens]